MVWIERGTFRMGSDLPDAPDNEKPPTLTTLSKGFWLARLETRQSLYEKINGENPSLIKGPDHPVENLAYLDAVEFCRRLTDLESKQGRLPKGHAYRLPSEAQWEFAARGGKERLPEDGPTFAERTWHRGNSPEGSHPAGSKSATVPGLHDMLGNVHEFCHGFHASYPGRHVVDWVGKSTLRLRIARGGSWFSPTSECTPAFRYVLPVTTATGTVGFRVALVDTGRN